MNVPNSVIDVVHVTLKVVTVQQKQFALEQIDLRIVIKVCGPP